MAPATWRRLCDVIGLRQSGGGLRAAGRDGAAMGKGRTALPDRWTDYLPLGKRIPGTRFIAFKVPLEESFECRLAPNERFTPQDLVNQVREQQEELGLIIDLTYTTRYYKPTDLPDSLQYCKILTVGHEVPSKKIISQFKNVVASFLIENRHNDKLIGVHCTHGLNRTGFLVCRYLIDIERMDPNWAIELFNRCRGHSIERKNYIEALMGKPCQRNPCEASAYGWIQEHVGPAYYHSGAQVFNYHPQKLEPFSQQVSRRRHQNTKEHKPQCGPQHPPAGNFSAQRWDHPVRPSHEPILYSPHQQQLPAHKGPSFPRHNPHPQHHVGRYKIDRRPNRKPY